VRHASVQPAARGVVSPARREQTHVCSYRSRDPPETLAWARRRHRDKSAVWIRKTYFTGSGCDPGTFRSTVTDPEGGSYPVSLVRLAAIRIRRHVKIQQEANPYDPAWELYFEERWATRLADTLQGQGMVRYLWLGQEGKGPVCDQPLTLEEGWHVHHLLWYVYGGSDDLDNLVLVHPNCHRQLHWQ